MVLVYQSQPLQNDRDACHMSHCIFLWCRHANKRAFIESWEHRSHLLDYYVERGLWLTHGSGVTNIHVMDALEIKLRAYRKIVQPCRLESIVGVKVKAEVPLTKLQDLEKILPGPIYMSLYDYAADVKFFYGNFAKRHEELPDEYERKTVGILEDHVGKFVIKDFAYMYDLKKHYLFKFLIEHLMTYILIVSMNFVDSMRTEKLKIITSNDIPRHDNRFGCRFKGWMEFCLINRQPWKIVHRSVMKQFYREYPIDNLH